MLKPVNLRQFEKEVATAVKLGKDIEKLKEIMKLLTFEKSLPAQPKS
jgi:mRNA interferase YafQ